MSIEVPPATLVEPAAPEPVLVRAMVIAPAGGGGIANGDRAAGRIRGRDRHIFTAIDRDRGCVLRIVQHDVGGCHGFYNSRATWRNVQFGQTSPFACVNGDAVVANQGCGLYIDHACGVRHLDSSIQCRSKLQIVVTFAAVDFVERGQGCCRGGICNDSIVTCATDKVVNAGGQVEGHAYAVDQFACIGHCFDTCGQGGFFDSSSQSFSTGDASDEVFSPCSKQHRRCSCGFLQRCSTRW